MPVPGRPRNPLHQGSDRFHRNRLMVMSRRQDGVGRTTTLIVGVTIRRVWRNLAGYVTAAGSSDFNWTDNAFEGMPNSPAVMATTPLRYMVSTRNTLTVGNQRSNPIMRPPVVRQRQSPRPPLVYAGNVQSRPVLRNRVISFGSRVRPLNAVSPDAIEQAGA